MSSAVINVSKLWYLNTEFVYIMSLVYVDSHSRVTNIAIHVFYSFNAVFPNTYYIKSEISNFYLLLFLNLLLLITLRNYFSKHWRSPLPTLMVTPNIWDSAGGLWTFLFHLCFVIFIVDISLVYYLPPPCILHDPLNRGGCPIKWREWFIYY